jgi:Transposase DDE domain/SWIM zinc finger
MDMRELKALEIAARSRITFDGATWHVPSQTTPGMSYRVTLDPKPRCNCEAFQLSGPVKPCKHVLAAQVVFARDGYAPRPEIVVDAVPKRPTYKQDWPAYNRAQATEKRRVQVLLADLTRNLPDRERPKGKGGPRPHRVADAVFAMAFKVYCGFSARRFSTDLDEAHEKGHVSRPIPGMKVTSFFEDPYFTPILKELIGHSARPLRVIETEFAIDSSGFSSSRFERWFDHKYGITRQKCVWVKTHIACGVKTNVVTAVRILDKDAGDCPQFVPLVKETEKRFEIGEVSADKAYASLENFEAVAACGGEAFIAFKSNATGGVGGQFEKAFHFFQFQREEFLKHYHKRSNVESTFSAIKRKFGDSVMSKTDTAMVNETLCKILCNNLTCLIQEQETLGIVPVFWQDEEPDEACGADVLPLVRPG